MVRNLPRLLYVLTWFPSFSIQIGVLLRYAGQQIFRDLGKGESFRCIVDFLRTRYPCLHASPTPSSANLWSGPHKGCIHTEQKLFKMPAFNQYVCHAMMSLLPMLPMNISHRKAVQCGYAYCEKLGRRTLTRSILRPSEGYGGHKMSLSCSGYHVRALGISWVS